jgi:hypothetical protein
VTISIFLTTNAPFPQHRALSPRYRSLWALVHPIGCHQQPISVGYRNAFAFRKIKSVSKRPFLFRSILIKRVITNRNMYVCIHMYTCDTHYFKSSPITLNDLRIPRAKDAKYLGLHSDRRLSWKATYSPSESNLHFKWKKCTGYSAVSHNCQLRTSCYTRQFSNLFGRPIVEPPIQI